MHWLMTDRECDPGLPQEFGPEHGEAVGDVSLDLMLRPGLSLWSWHWIENSRG